LFFQFDVIVSMLGYIFHPPANSIRERKRLKYEGSAYLQQNCPIIWKLRNYTHLASKTEKQLEGVHSPCKHCALCGYHGKHWKWMVFHK